MGTFNTVDENNVFPYAMAAVDRGLCVQDGVNGFGLVTSGFLWQAYDIWIKIEKAAPITTTWTPSQFGVFGELPPRD